MASQFFRYVVLCCLVACAEAFSIDAFRSSKCQTSSSLAMVAKPLESISFFKFNKPKSNDRESNELLKMKIKTLAKGTQNGITASDLVRAEIDIVVKQLEKNNPTRKLSSSPKLDGSWGLVYTSNEGSSAGKLGPFVGDVEQLIRLDKDAPEYINYVRLGNGAVEGALTATWDVVSPTKWRVKFEKIKFLLFGLQLVEKDLDAVGIWRMSYLDDDFRILYAIGGKNTEVENIYILSK